MDKFLKTGKVIAMASQGQGIVKNENLVTFIPFTATGDEIHYQVTEIKKNYAIGKLVDISQKSSQRTTPKCPYFENCGGCQLQHVTYLAQLEYKRQWIEDSLKKIGKFENIFIPPIQPAHPEWAYRRKIQLILKKQDHHYIAGFIANDNVSLVQVETCPIFINSSDLILKIAQSICVELKSDDTSQAKLTVLKNESGYLFHFHFKKMPENAHDVLKAHFKFHESLTGVIATSQKESFQYGIIHSTCTIEGLIFDFNSKSFIQNHPEQSTAIYQTLAQLVEKLKPITILDLYCGIGITTLLLAKQDRNLKGIELNPESISLAKLNAKKNNIKNADFLIGNVEFLLPDLLKNSVPDLIILNPPREGLADGVRKAITSKPAKALIYISCNPSTLARDLYDLCQNGYLLTSIQGFDMFPQTIHVEMVATLIYQLKDINDV